MTSSRSCWSSALREHHRTYNRARTATATEAVILAELECVPSVVKYKVNTENTARPRPNCGYASGPIAIRMRNSDRLETLLPQMASSMALSHLWIKS